MPPAYLKGPVSVTTGQPVSDWVDVRSVSDWKAVLYNNDGSNGAHMLIEVAEEVAGGVAVKSEFVAGGADLYAPPSGQVTFVQNRNTYNFVRVSATGDSPSYPSTSVSAGVTRP